MDALASTQDAPRRTAHGRRSRRLSLSRNFADPRLRMGGHFVSQFVSIWDSVQSKAPSVIESAKLTRCRARGLARRRRGIRREPRRPAEAVHPAHGVDAVHAARRWAIFTPETGRCTCPRQDSSLQPQAAPGLGIHSRYPRARSFSRTSRLRACPGSGVGAGAEASQSVRNAWRSLCARSSSAL
jgi:hypothetical protein